MITDDSILIKAPVDRIFETAADLSHWPDFLPHYRSVTYLERSPGRNLVRMCARRGWIPVWWTSEQVIDRDRREVRFLHLKAFTRGMRVVWTFEPQSDGVRVRIHHRMEPNLPVLGRFIADRIVGKFFVQSIAARTLEHMKRHVENSLGG